MAGERPDDPGRRQFFRTVGRQTAAGAGRAIGAADSLRRGGTALAGELLGVGLGDPAEAAPRLTRRSVVPPAAGFGSAYRCTGDALVLLDQRRLPGERAEVVLREASEVAAALRAGVIGGGPILGEVAAYAIALAARASRDRPSGARRQAIGAAASALVAARAGVHAVRHAAQRMVERSRRLVEEVDGGAAADALLDEADAIAATGAEAHARLGRVGAETIGAAGEGHGLTLLLHGDMGPLSCGLVGTGVAVVQSLLASGRQVHVWLTEAGPAAEGRRISAPQLAQLDIPHTVVDDAALGWLLDSRPIDAVLLRADTVYANGDCAGPLGGATVARVAAGSGVPVHACAPTPAIDRGSPTGASLPLELPLPDGEPAAGSVPRLEPLTDVVPAGLLVGVITEQGVLRPPFAG